MNTDRKILIVQLVAFAAMLRFSMPVLAAEYKIFIFLLNGTAEEYKKREGYDVILLRSPSCRALLVIRFCAYVVPGR